MTMMKILCALALMATMAFAEDKNDIQKKWREAHAAWWKKCFTKDQYKPRECVQACKKGAGFDGYDEDACEKGKDCVASCLTFNGNYVPRCVAACEKGEYAEAGCVAGCHKGFDKAKMNCRDIWNPLMKEKCINKSWEREEDCKGMCETFRKKVDMMAMAAHAHGAKDDKVDDKVYGRPGMKGRDAETSKY